MKTRTTKALMFVVAAGCFSTLAVEANEARACGGEWAPEVQIDHRIQGVARAEKMFDAGKADQAAASVIRMMPHIATLKASRSTLVERAQRILAVAVARADGALPVEHEVPSYAQGSWVGAKQGQRQANLTWAIQALREVGELKKDDPSVQTDLAEALAKVPEHQNEARTLLESLAKRDLVSTPEGYATLAELRSRAGDAKGQKLALERCAAMAKSSAVCRSGQAQS
ncbi:MAG TPA: hypothetical protein VK524_24920 [Polyangiaceae bacterium]|nr:hypothetical protein [Polyangiaceae bacterium]